MNLDIRIRDAATPFIDAVQRAFSVPEVTPFVGASVAETFRQNFLAEDQFPNRLGGERTHYFAKAAENTDWTMDADNLVTIRIRQVGIGLRYFGGTITAGKGPSCITGKTTKYLTIPATAEAYGKRACDFSDLVVLWGRNGPYALGRRSVGTIATQGGGSATAERAEVLFWLKQSVTIQPDDGVLPSNEVISTNLNRDLLQYARDVHQAASEEANERAVEKSVMTGFRPYLTSFGGDET